MTQAVANVARKVRLGASVACANLARLEDDLRLLADSGIDSLHIDIMDGRFVSNFALDFSLMETVGRITTLPLDCHLMIENPERYIGRAAAAGAQYIAIHYEATPHAQKALQQIRDAGAKAAIALNPATPVQCLEYVLDDIDVVTIMTVNPGATGQKLIPAMLRKIADTRHMLDAAGYPDVEIQVDGNVSFAHIPAMVEAGATMLVGGTSSVFHGDYSIPDAVHAVRQMVERLGQAG
ncbi:MAG TPA: ribulose-phosphate 3-epimerase [Acidobacteriaceae bacterium]|jgi:ribulose-phosphate 3-epimerase|nr:ribulose-phosphate 3-epimerase [Acidobacteriaceae bacterium]